MELVTVPYLPHGGLPSRGLSTQATRDRVSAEPGCLCRRWCATCAVDLAQEFTSLIVAQRGFQANSRVITKSGEMLPEVVNLKR
jgi:flagellar basal body rod protein FlgG